MKRTCVPFLLFSFTAIFTLLIASSCKKSSNISDSSNSVSATVSGTNFSTSTTASFYSQSGADWDISGVSIKSGDTVVVEAMIFAPFTLNQPFNTDTTNTTLFYSTNGSSGKQYGAGSYWFGSGNGLAVMTVTSLDTTAHKISGTFSGSLYTTASDSVVVTNGKFSSSYTVEP
jgi:hypothetical protein